LLVSIHLQSWHARLQYRSTVLPCCPLPSMYRADLGGMNTGLPSAAPRIYEPANIFMFSFTAPQFQLPLSSCRYNSSHSQAPPPPAHPPFDSVPSIQILGRFLRVRMGPSPPEHPLANPRVESQAAPISVSSSHAPIYRKAIPGQPELQPVGSLPISIVRLVLKLRDLVSIVCAVLLPYQVGWCSLRRHAFFCQEEAPLVRCMTQSRRLL
jgi:hypothetical protein